MKAVMYNYNTWIKYKPEEEIIQDFENILIRSGFTIINKVEHYFTKQGYTGLWLLSESHFAIHTFPEEGKIYIEISSCVKKYYDIFLLFLKEYLQKTEHEEKYQDLVQLLV